MAEGRYRLTTTAYIKPILHSLKYASATVTGVLLGKQEKGSSVEVVDAIPLFHQGHSVTPMLELALAQVDEYASKDGLSIVGFYVANERSDDVELGPTARKVADKLFANFSNACALVVDTPRLASIGLDNRPPGLLVHLYTRDSQKPWKRVSLAGASPAPIAIKEGDANSLLTTYIQGRKHELLADFDDHLDDVRKDWTNSALLLEG